MPLPYGSYYPSAKFRLPRSYVYDLIVYANGNGIVRVGNNIIISTPPTGFPVAVISLFPQFVAWSSNVYTLDYIIDASYYQTVSGGAHIDLPFSLSYQDNALTGRPALVYAYFGLTTDPHAFPLDAQPSNYWLPLPLP